MSRTVTLVVNPTAGKGRAQELLPQVAGRFRDVGDTLQVLLSRDFREAQKLAAQAVDQGVDILAVMGGDGMMHLGVNTVASRLRPDGTPTRLGLIPAGTGNDLCRGIGLPADPVRAAEVIVVGRTKKIDLLRIGNTYVGGVVATGFDAMVNHRANNLPWPKGSLRYPLAALSELRVFDPLDYRIVVDGDTRTLPAMLIAVGNTPSYGGGMQICPGADPTDGLLDVTIIHPVSRIKLLRLLPQMYSGKFAKDPAVERFRARRVEIDGAGLVAFGDGEMIGAAPISVETVPDAVTVFIP